ncbi:MAG: excalibur calcium-binding domain-containing protein [Acidimicrobiia bacterium]
MTTTQPAPATTTTKAIPNNPGDSKNCGDFPTQREAQAWFDKYYPYYGDVARLDADNDGIACESLP